MEHKDRPNSSPHPISKNSAQPSLSSDAVAVYTAFHILLKMRSDLSLEAMLEYIEKHLSAIDAHNPVIKNAVMKALKLISVEKIYKEVTG